MSLNNIELAHIRLEEDRQIGMREAYLRRALPEDSKQPTRKVSLSTRLANFVKNFQGRLLRQHQTGERIHKLILR